MKIRTDFVTNSSSSSYIFARNDFTSDEVKRIHDRFLEKFEEEANNLDHFYKSMEEKYGIPRGFSSYRDSELYDMMQLFEWVLHGVKPMREWDDEDVCGVCGWYYRDILRKLLLRCVSADVAAEHDRMLRDAEQKNDWDAKWKLEEDSLRLLMEKADAPDEATLRSLAGAWLLNNLWIPYVHPSERVHKTCSAEELLGMLEKDFEKEWHDELYPFVTAHYDHFREQLLTFADTPLGDVLAAAMEAGYMYFDSMETHYVVGDAFSEDELCLFGCNHMG